MKQRNRITDLVNILAAISARRWLLLLTGLVCFGIGIALMVAAGLGLGPWESFHQGISIHTGIPIGTVSILIGAPILLLWLPLGERINVGTLLNVVLIGLVTNLSLPLLPRFDVFIPQFVMMISGILVIGLGSGLYLTSKLGAGPRDGVMMGLARRTGWSIRVARTLIEVIVLAGGWLLGGSIGIGTLAFALGIGPVVQFMFKLLGNLPTVSLPVVPVTSEEPAG